jgi:hypothetical protein
MIQRIVARLLTVVVVVGMLRAQVTSNVLQRVFEIASEGQGTAFTVNVQQRQYLVTAAHLLPSKKDKLVVKVAQDGSWKDLSVEVLRCPEGVDIAVLVPPAVLSGDFPMGVTSDHLQVGQDVFFLGFPHQLSMSFAMFSGHPFALVKRGTVAGFRGRGHGIEGFLLDGMNVKGFSGGPVVFRPDPSSMDFRVAGVIGGYIWEALPVMQKGTKGSADIETTSFVKANTGLAYGWDIRFAVEAIQHYSTGSRNAQ